jgi:hypothetical protein
MAGRPKEYKNNFRFNSTMEGETYHQLKRLTAINDIEMNTIFQHAAEQFIAKYGEGQAIPQKEPDLPSILSHKDEILRWAHGVGPDGARKGLDNLSFLYKCLSEQMRAIELSVKNKAKVTTTN